MSEQNYAERPPDPASAVSASAGAAVGFDFRDFAEWLDAVGRLPERGVVAAVGSAHAACRTLGCAPEQPGPWAYVSHLAHDHGLKLADAPVISAVVASAYAKAKMRVRVHGAKGVLRRRAGL